jgi:glycosyltransferase involved in cell wall biosynthesis
VSQNGEVPSGLNRYTGELLKAMLGADSSLLGLVTNRASPELIRRGARQVSPGLLAHTGFPGNAARLAWHHLRLPSLLRSERAELYFSPLPEGSTRPVCRQVITIHDLLPLRFPDFHPRLKYYYAMVLPRIIAASEAIIATSEATRRDIERRWGHLGKPVHVVYQGFRHDVFRPSSEEATARVRAHYGLDRFLLAVGDPRPHKNLEGLMRAFARLNAPDVQLAIVGKTGDPAEWKSLLSSLGIAERVRILGVTPDADLAALYSAAIALVFPSHYEGFGIPPLEALACGCPVVVSRVASLPEVCGEAALYVDSSSVDSIALGMAQMIGDESLRATLRAQGLERARAFRYPTAAREILDILDG